MSFNPSNRDSNPKHGIGRVAPTRKISPHEAKQEALQMLRSGKVRANTKLRHTTLLLGTAGVLLEEQVLELIGISKRTLQRYRQKGILDVVPTPLKLTKILKVEHRIWTLGPIGTALAEMLQGDDLIPSGYLETKVDRVTHDTLCNLVYYHLYLATRELGYTAILLSKYEATIHNKKGQPILEPDACIILQSGNQSTKFLVEYHNENFSSRAAEKVKKYEYVYEDALWREQWHVKTFPPILIVTTHGAVAHGYKRDIEERNQGVGVKCRYLIKPLKSFLAKVNFGAATQAGRENSQSPLVWLDLAKNKTVNILNQ